MLVYTHREIINTQSAGVLDVLLGDQRYFQHLWVNVSATTSTRSVRLLPRRPGAGAGLDAGVFFNTAECSKNDSNISCQLQTVKLMLTCMHCVSGAVNTQGFVWKVFMRYI